MFCKDSSLIGMQVSGDGRTGWFFSVHCVKIHWWNDLDPAVVTEAPPCRLRVWQYKGPGWSLTRGKQGK